MTRLFVFGTTTTGVLTNCRFEDVDERNSSQSFYLAYRVKDGTVDFSGESMVSQEDFVEHKTGDQVTVTYLRSNPSINCFGGRSYALWNAGYMVFGVGFCSLIAMISLGLFLFGEPRSEYPGAGRGSGASSSRWRRRRTTV